MGDTKTYNEHLVTFAEGWVQSLDDLAPKQVRDVRRAAVDLTKMVDGPVTAEFLVGLGLGSQMVGAFETVNPLTEAMRALTPNAPDPKTLALMVVACAASMLLDGEFPA